MSPTEALRVAVFCFGVDRVTAEVTAALGAAGIPTIVVKGPAISTWLYAAEGTRLYGDTDLLLREADWERAAGVLGALGFEDDLAPLGHPRMESAAGHLWVRRRDGAEVDLHQTLFGIGAAPAELWRRFSASAIRERVGGAEVSMPSYPARLLHVALHAVQHGGDAAKPLADLERALAVAPEETWRRAHELARDLRAAEGFAAGLRLAPGGAEMLARLGAGQAAGAEATLRIEGVPLAEGFEQLARAGGPRAKLGLLARELFPSRAFMRWWSPLARRGNRGLAFARAWRLVWLGYRAIPGYLAWRRASGDRAAPQDRRGRGRSWYRADR